MVPWRRRLACWATACLAAGAALGAAPTISSFSPAFGGPGTQVTIRGANLSPVSRVTFYNSSPAAVVSQSSTQLVVVEPADAQTGPIVVYTGGGFGQSAASFRVSPEITDFYVNGRGQGVSPVVATAGETLIIDGANFSDPGGSTTVFIGGVQVPATVVSFTQINATLTSSVGTGRVTVTTPSGTATSSSYVYFNPVVTQFPASAVPGQPMVVLGTSFLDMESVLIGSVQAPISAVGATNVTATVPIGAIDGPVTVTAPGGSFVTASSLKILPLVTSFSPAGGPPGTVVTLTGGGFTGATDVHFGNLAASSFSVADATHLTATAPAGVATAAIRVTTPNGTTNSPALFYAAPKLTGSSPSTGEPGAAVMLSGTGLTGATQVFLGSLASTFSVQSDQVINTTVPAGAVTNGYWRVVTPGGTATNPSVFTVLGPQPSITGFSPAFGATGTVVKIQGAHLDIATGVAFNGAPASFTFSGSTLSAVVPPNAATGLISVTNPYGVAKSAAAFIVGTSADLAVTVSPQFNPAYAYSPLAVVVGLRNFGPLPSAAPLVTVALSANLTFVSVDNVANFDLIGTNVLLRPGDQAPGANLSATIHLRAGAPGTVRVGASAQSVTPDLKPSNNSAAVSLPAVLPSLELDGVGTNAFSLLWPSQAASFVLETTASPVPGPWAAVTNTPTDDGVSRQLVLPYRPGFGFYRLRWSGTP